MRLTILLSLMAALVHAQPGAIPAAGIEPTWDIAVVLEALAANAKLLGPVLNRLDAAAWVARGASATYAEQVESSRQQARALAEEAHALAQNPERLSGALALFFRMEALERMTTSIEDAARRYQAAQSAQDVASVYAEGGANRERLRRYIVTLAAEREHQFEVMDKEAQRCRATLIYTPAVPRSTAKKK